MVGKTVFLVAFLEQDNLGIGYIASVLINNGIDVKILDFRFGKEQILQEALRYDPDIIGFSIIFQYHIADFRDMIKYLKDNGVSCHFTAGGHYPSLRYSVLMNMIPGLDSVVLFEGEYTFLELTQSVYESKEWKQIEGIAYRKNGSVIANPLRPLEVNLDNFPSPVRQPLKEYAIGKKYATILAGRGCYYNCSFCSIREFYSKPKGPIKRVRKPEMVVREMELLYKQKDCTIFMFQDDDFPVSASREENWATYFCELLIKTGLSKKVLWKINCRPDEINSDVLKLLKDTGLFLVYLGIENGTDDGLRLMNKRMTAQTNIEAVTILKNMDIKYDFGFMLFHPEATFISVMENLDFLMKICGDGSSPITFCKMLPYAETRIEYKLRREGRLKGKPGFEDYDFLEAPLNRLYLFMIDCFGDWMRNHDGLLNIARWTRYYLIVYKKFFPSSSTFLSLEREAEECISRSNKFFININKKLVNIYNTKNHEKICDDELRNIKDYVKKNHLRYQQQLIGILNKVESLACEEENKSKDNIVL